MLLRDGSSNLSEVAEEHIPKKHLDFENPI
jgi:hypothetical protein